jgi:hypothetical protein
MDVRGKVLGAEIDSERIAQGILEAQSPPVQEKIDGEPFQLAAHSLRHYFKILSHQLNGKNHDAVVTLLRGTFPDVAIEQIEAALKN